MLVHEVVPRPVHLLSAGPQTCLEVQACMLEEWRSCLLVVA